MHFTGSIHSTRSVTSTLKSAATEKSIEGDDDAAAAAGRGGLVLGRRRQLDAVRNRVSAAARFILEYYAETTGRRLADVLQVRFFVSENWKVFTVVTVVVLVLDGRELL